MIYIHLALCCAVPLNEMSFADTLSSMREQGSIDQKQTLIERFNRLKRAPREEVLSEYNKIKKDFADKIRKEPSAFKYVIDFPKQVSKCMTLLDMLIEDGICNFELNKEGKILSKRMMTVYDSEGDLGYGLFDNDYTTEVLLNYTVTVQYPFNKSVFE